MDLNRLDANLLPAAIGSLPHDNAGDALDLVRTFLPEIPFWPQLPRRSPLEQMQRQFLPGLPGLTCEDGPRISLDRGREEALRLYEAVIEEREWVCPPEERAAGLYAFMNSQWNEAKLIKGHILGPVSLGLSVMDEQGLPVMYSPEIMDWVVNHLALAVRWQQRFLAEQGAATLVLFDEPYMATYGSAHFPYSAESVRTALRGVLDGLEGLRGVHCCGNTDWDLILDLDVHVVSFDAHNYGRQFCLHGDRIQCFLQAGGTLAWGIVPVNDDVYRIDAGDLVRRWTELAGELSCRTGFSIDEVARSSLLTPACGLGPADVALATRAFSLLRESSDRLRAEYL